MEDFAIAFQLNCYRPAGLLIDLDIKKWNCSFFGESILYFLVRETNRFVGELFSAAAAAH